MTRKGGEVNRSERLYRGKKESKVSLTSSAEIETFVELLCQNYIGL